MPKDTSFAQTSSRLLPMIEKSLADAVAFPGIPETTLIRAMRYTLLLPGKRLRPLLTLLACEACGGSVDDALPAACAVEMVHAFSLIHDDLPCMDDDDLRRGKATNHVVFGEAQALLAGDALLSFAFEVLSHDAGSKPAPQVQKNLSPEIALVCTRELAMATMSMIEGQSLDMEGFGGHPSPEQIEGMERQKTGALIVASLRMGGIVTGASEEQLAALSEYGWRLGLAFQILDDLLDVEGSEKETGKRVGKDVEKGKRTSPSIFGVEQSRKRIEQLIAQACDSMKPFEKCAGALISLAESMREKRR
ncbi:polyprenyl synthetase family protein [Candidatus Peregrinibacteria bacterium]|nr:polyprenyl synthetase family protein [Candidatus Peregrinibacteria bacterium]